MSHSISVSTSGLVAQRARMDTIAANIANLHTTRNEKGESVPFQRQIVLFQAAQEYAADGAPKSGAGVKFDIARDPDAKPRRVADADHPDAVDGYVSYPDIDLNTEFVNAVEASRAYEANLAAIEISKSMLNQTLRLFS